MKRKKKREQPGSFSLSFLDAVSCGFGALVILLVLTKMGEPKALEDARQDLDARIALLQQELVQIQGETVILEREMITRTEQLSDEKIRLARLKGDLTDFKGKLQDTAQLSEVQEKLEGRLVAAQQKLTEEMKRLLGESYKRPERDNTVGGIPVDSEYIIFVIDTSGSMVSFAWPLMLRKMEEVLNIYPSVKGIQVMNDMGQYMFPGYVQRWIPDTPSRRRLILNTLRTWHVFSNSSPVEGIERAIRGFAKGDEKISIYVFGDEFTGRSIQEVVERVDLINPRDAEGKRKVRIHGVGFPTVFSQSNIMGGQTTGVRFATLMRALCRRNDGTFVALNSSVR
ncbi:MAG: VWA domain-containing protein [Acidobacteriota bacterium]|nr:VWA domain-containing protein [Acidobacteriota bacterium]